MLEVIFLFIWFVEFLSLVAIAIAFTLCFIYYIFYAIYHILRWIVSKLLTMFALGIA